MQVIWPHNLGKKVPYKLQINTMQSLVPSSRSPQKKTWEPGEGGSSRTVIFRLPYFPLQAQ